MKKFIFSSERLFAVQEWQGEYKKQKKLITEGVIENGGSLSACERNI